MPSKPLVKVGDTVKLTGKVYSIKEDGFMILEFPTENKGETFFQGMHHAAMSHAEIIPKTLEIPGEVVDAIKLELLHNRDCITTEGRGYFDKWLDSHRAK